MRILTLIIILFMISVNVISQNKNEKTPVIIKGEVTNYFQPIPNHRVVMAVKGQPSFQETYTDTEGNFTFPTQELILNTDKIRLYVVGIDSTYGGWPHVGSWEITVRDSIEDLYLPVAHDDTIINNITAFGYNYITSNQIQFIDLTTSTDSTTYKWYFGDGDTSLLSNPIHTFTVPDQFLVMLHTKLNEEVNGYSQIVSVTLDYEYFGKINVETSHNVNFDLRVYPIDNPEEIYYNAVVYSENKFGLIELPEGNYIAEAIPKNVSMYAYPIPLPTYFPNQLFWTNADTLIAGEENIIEVVTADFFNSGFNEIHCQVEDPNNLLIHNPTFLLLNSEYEPLTMAFESDDLQCSFIDLQAGTYLVYPQYPGKITIPHEVTFEYENEPTQYLEFEVTETHIAPPGMSIDEVSQGFSIYPNPANNKCFISSGSRIESLKIRDLSGKIIMEQYGIKGHEYNLDLESFPKGVYIISIETQGEMITEKLIIE